jgi:hypothetical protein
MYSRTLPHSLRLQNIVGFVPQSWSDLCGGPRPITPSDNSCPRERHLSLVMATAAICNIVLAARKRPLVIRFLGKADVFRAE